MDLRCLSFYVGSMGNSTSPPHLNGTNRRNDCNDKDDVGDYEGEPPRVWVNPLVSQQADEEGQVSEPKRLQGGELHRVSTPEKVRVTARE